MVDWNWNDITKEDLKIVNNIVRRAKKTRIDDSDFVFTLSQLRNLCMDLSATHIGTPLKLKELLEADDLNFIHDVSGIQRYIDRETGMLTDCFVPRFAV